MNASFKNFAFVTSMGIALAIVGTASAVETTVPLTDLISSYEYPESTFPSSFFQIVDFGKQYSSINSIRVDITATGTQGEADFGVGDIGPFDPEVEITVGSSTQSVGTIVGTDSRSAHFDSTIFDLSEFLDGTGTIMLAIDEVFANDFFLSASLQVSAATATIHGKPVPEPATGLLILSTLAMVFCRRSLRVTIGPR